MFSIIKSEKEKKKKEKTSSDGICSKPVKKICIYILRFQTAKKKSRTKQGWKVFFFVFWWANEIDQTEAVFLYCTVESLFSTAPQLCEFLQTITIFSLQKKRKKFSIFCLVEEQKRKAKNNFADPCLGSFNNTSKKKKKYYYCCK